MAEQPSPRPGNAATAAIIFAIGFATSLLGDAGHVASGTTEYLWDEVPEIWRSAVWFPFAVSGAILLIAFIGHRAGLPGVRSRNRVDVAFAVAAVLGLYALTSVLHGQPTTVAVIACSSVAALIVLWWDPSPGAFALAIAAAIVGPAAEMLVMEIGAARYLPGSDGLVNVSPMLPPLYFAAGGVASGMWQAIQRPATRTGA